jgi:hypothetical protein
MKKRTLLYLEYEPDQIFYVNGFKKDIIEKYLAPNWEPTGLYALWDDFHLVFKKTTIIPDTEKFYYPIIVSLWEVNKVFDQISLSSTIIQKVKNGQCKIIMICPFEGWTWTWWDELATILKQKFLLTDADIIFMSANYQPHDKHNTIVFNTWERQIFANYSTKEHYDNSLSRIGDTRPNKFICLNRRPSIHRHAVVASLFNLRDQGILTCAVKGGYSDWYQNWVEENFINEYPEFASKYKEEIKPQLPLTFNDGINPEVDNPAANEWGKVEKYYSSYLYIVTETFFEGKAQGESTLFLSEKIFKPMIFFQPFVAFARPGIIKLLQDLGYKTFGNYIDESYDSVEDDKERLYAAVHSVKKFIELPQEQLTSQMIEMCPIFEHNYNMLKENYEHGIFNNLRASLYNNLHESPR